jgi:hypothetical protein
MNTFAIIIDKTSEVLIMGYIYIYYKIAAQRAMLI